MSKLLKSLSEEEINSVADFGKGCPYHSLILCGANYDSGSCNWVFEQCGSKPSPGTGSVCKSGSVSTCRN